MTSGNPLRTVGYATDGRRILIGTFQMADLNRLADYERVRESCLRLFMSVAAIMPEEEATTVAAKMREMLERKPK